MPDSAVALGGVDLFVPVEQMPDHIVAAHEIRLTALREAAQPGVNFDSIRLAICDILRSRLGHDFSQYKQQTFMRRVQRRMKVLRLTNYDAYIADLKANRD
jgi:two-component system, chemotaxis family, CheB/CheR fusion protein